MIDKGFSIIDPFLLVPDLTGVGCFRKKGGCKKNSDHDPNHQDRPKQHSDGGSLSSQSIHSKTSDSHPPHSKSSTTGQNSSQDPYSTKSDSQPTPSHSGTSDQSSSQDHTQTSKHSLSSSGHHSKSNSGSTNHYTDHTTTSTSSSAGSSTGTPETGSTSTPKQTLSATKTGSSKPLTTDHTRTQTTHSQTTRSQTTSTSHRRHSTRSKTRSTSKKSSATSDTNKCYATLHPSPKLSGRPKRSELVRIDKRVQKPPVGMGQVETGDPGDVLVTHGLDTCISLAAVGDNQRKVLAHLSAVNWELQYETFNNIAHAQLTNPKYAMSCPVPQQSGLGAQNILRGMCLALIDKLSADFPAGAAQAITVRRLTTPSRSAGEMWILADNSILARTCTTTSLGRREPLAGANEASPERVQVAAAA